MINFWIDLNIDWDYQAWWLRDESSYPAIRDCFYSTNLTDRRNSPESVCARVVLMSSNEFATHSLEKLSRGSWLATVRATQKSRERDNDKERDEERNKNGKRKETERGWLSCCRRRPISGSGALIHFILCALKRRSIKAGKSHRDSTLAQKGGGQGGAGTRKLKPFLLLYTEPEDNGIGDIDHCGSFSRHNSR